MTSNNSEENKFLFKNKFEIALLDLVDKNIEIFNILRDNQPAKNMIFQAIYRNYLNDLGKVNKTVDLFIYRDKK